MLDSILIVILATLEVVAIFAIVALFAHLIGLDEKDNQKEDGTDLPHEENS